MTSRKYQASDYNFRLQQAIDDSLWSKDSGIGEAEQLSLGKPELLKFKIGSMIKTIKMISTDYKTNLHATFL